MGGDQALSIRDMATLLDVAPSPINGGFRGKRPNIGDTVALKWDFPITENQSMAAGARGIVVARGRNGLQVQFDDTMIYAPYRQVKIVE